MSNLQEKNDLKSIEVLPEDVPVTMPELPLRLTISTVQQFKAINDPVRTRILGILQHQPATAKQIADRLGIAPGTVGHHMQVLEDAGLIQVVALRQVRGMLAKYYTRSAFIFDYELPPEIVGSLEVNLEFIDLFRNEQIDAIVTMKDDPFAHQGFPHLRLSPERAAYWAERVIDLIEELIHEKQDPDGTVYGFFISMFTSPPYMQVSTTPEENDSPDN